MRKIFLLVATAMCMTSCWTLIETTAPTTSTAVIPVKTVYTTQVTTPSPKVVTTTTVTVTSYDQDWSFYLDLRAVAAAFAEANNIQQFERIINSSNYMINNLDLNRDGWIDYLRVIETRQGYYHALLIQACLAPGVFQDVATLIAERRKDLLYVEVIGDKYLYGYNYIVRPVFVKRPPLWDAFGRSNYTVWSSPYHHGNFPSYYGQPKPVYLNHYQAYVNTYMTNHHYCHQCDFPQQPFWNGYDAMVKPHVHNDFARQHPDDAFDRRVTHYDRPQGTTGEIRNAGQLRTATSTRTGQSTQTTQATRSTQSTQSTATRSAQTTTTRSAQTSQSTATRSAQTSTSAQSRQAQAAAQREPSTSVNTRVSRSGETRTTIKTTDENGRTQTVQRNASSTRSASSTRTSGATRSASSTRR